MKENNYYVYIYLDPRKKGKYSYDGLNMSFLYQPFYVGKGNRCRIKQHLAEHSLKKNSYKNQKIKKIRKEINQNPYFFKLYKKLSNKQSQELEIKIIKSIGRYDLNLGTLTNQTDGGDGGLGNSNSKGERNGMYGKKGLDNPLHIRALERYKEIKEKETQNILKRYNNGLKAMEIAKIYHVNASFIREILKKNDINTKLFHSNKEYREKRDKAFSEAYKKKYKQKLKEYKEQIIDLYLNKKYPVRKIQKELNLSDRTCRRIIKDLKLKRSYIGIGKKARKKGINTLKNLYKNKRDILYKEYKNQVIEYIKNGLYQEQIADKLPFSIRGLRDIFKRLVQEYNFDDYMDFREYLLNMKN